jgi:hypothetical protein
MQDTEIAIKYHRLLSLLLPSVEAAGMSLSPDRYIRLQRLWLMLPDDCAIDALQNLLCPIFATDERQQDAFMEAFERIVRINSEFIEELNLFQFFSPFREKLKPLISEDKKKTEGKQKNSQFESNSYSDEQDFNSDEQDLGSKTEKETKNSNTDTQDLNEISQPDVKPNLKNESQSVIPKISFSRPLVVDLEKCTEPPYSWNIAPKDHDAEINIGEGFSKTLLQLRRREWTDNSDIDVPNTIKATIAEGGMPNFRFKRQTRPPEYLLLVERFSRNDHRAGLFDYVFQALRVNEVFVERFFYDSDPRINRNEQYPAGLNLNELRNRFPDARLVLLGSGYRLLSPRTGKLAEWALPLQSWRVRALLTPVPHAEWGYQERQLDTAFLLLPASVESLQYIAETPDAGEVQYELLPDYLREIAETEPINLQDPIMRSLRQHFDSGMLCWIAACAVYPALHFDLTLQLGKVISTSLGYNLVTAPNLLALSRLTWFTSGRIPVPVRTELMKYMEQRHPERRVLVLAYLRKLMEENPPTNTNSVAYAEHRVNLAVLKAVAGETDAETVAELRAVVKRLDREASWADFVLPEVWGEILSDTTTSDIQETTIEEESREISKDISSEKFLDIKGELTQIQLSEIDLVNKIQTNIPEMLEKKHGKDSNENLSIKNGEPHKSHLRENGLNTTIPLVFINYRWCDSSAATGRIYDHLKKRLKHDRIFLDRYGIDGGDEIGERINENLLAKVLLVIIGKNWLEALKERAKTGEKDYVSEEINKYILINPTSNVSTEYRLVPIFLPDLDVAQLKKEQEKHLLVKVLLDHEAITIPDYSDRWDLYMDDLANKIRKWTLPPPEQHVRQNLQNWYQTDDIFTKIGFSSELNSNYQAFGMEEYFITPSYIPVDDLQKRGDWINKEKESSSIKIRKQQLLLQNFIHQDYASERLLDASDHVLIIGNPGIGKSTFARWLCHQWANKISEYTSIPFYISLRELPNFDATTFWEHIAKCLKLNDGASAKLMLKELYLRIQWILDGYDELSPAKQLQLHKTMNTVFDEQKPRYILLSRPYGMLYNPGFAFEASFQLDGFNYGQIKDYVQQFLQKNGQSDQENALLGLLRENRVLEDYAHNPMMLSFIVGLFLTATDTAKLKAVQSQYELQAMVYAWIRKREIEKSAETKLPEHLEVTNEQERFAYDMEIKREFIYEGEQGLSYASLNAATALSNMGLGRMDTFITDFKVEKYRFSFNSVTFQEFLAARHLQPRISPKAFGLLCRVPFFWNFSKMLIGCLGANRQDETIKEILDELRGQYSTTAGNQNHFKFYLFAVQLSECSKTLVNSMMNTDTLRHLYQMYLMNATHSPIWKSLLMEAIRKLYFKLDRGKVQKLKDWILDDINPEGKTKNLGEDSEMFSVQDGVKLMVQQLELWNDPYFIQNIVIIVQDIAPKMDVDVDADFDIYAYEPLAFMLDDVLAKCDSETLQTLKGDLLPVLNLLPNEFIGASTRLKALMPLLTADETWDSFLTISEEIAVGLKKSKKLSKRAQKSLFAKLRLGSELMFFWGKGRTLESKISNKEVIAICRYFHLTSQLINVVEIEEYDLEEIFQLCTESVSTLRETSVYRAVLDFSWQVQPSYSGLVFADGDHFFKWYEQSLADALSSGQEHRLLWFITALTLADILQMRFVKISTPFCKLTRLYVRKHSEVFDKERGSFTEVHIENAADPTLEILRPLEKLVYFGREDSAWGEADKLALVDMGLEAEFRELRYFKDNFLPGLMGTQFSLYRQEHWDFVHACCSVERLPVLFSILRNRQIFQFGANLSHLVKILGFIHSNLDAPHLDERPSLIIEIAARCLRLIKTNLEMSYDVDAKRLLRIVQSLLVNPKVQVRFILEETIGVLEGEDALAFVTCHFLAPDKRLCFVRDYDALFGEHHRERHRCIEGLVEFFSDKEGLVFDDLRSVYSHIGAVMAEKIEWYIGVNEWEYRFDVEEFEGMMG